MSILIWFVATPVLVLLGTVALELMQRAVIDEPENPETPKTRRR